MKVQHTLITLADPVAIHIGEQCRRAVRQRGKQVFGLARFEPQLRRGCASSRLQPSTHRMVLMISGLNLAGDKQADLTVHGGAQKAIYGYPAEHYEYWRNELPDVPFSWGKFGENLTTEGLRENTLYIGDRLRVGSAILKVTHPRMPC